MDRRNFFKRVALAAVGFSNLPAATTYARSWKFSSVVVAESPVFVINPDYFRATHEIYFPSNGYPMLIKKLTTNPRAMRFSFDSEKGVFVREQALIPKIMKEAIDEM